MYQGYFPTLQVYLQTKVRHNDMKQETWKTVCMSTLLFNCL